MRRQDEEIKRALSKTEGSDGSDCCCRLLYVCFLFSPNVTRCLGMYKTQSVVPPPSPHCCLVCVGHNSYRENHSTICMLKWATILPCLAQLFHRVAFGVGWNSWIETFPYSIYSCFLYLNTCSEICCYYYYWYYYKCCYNYTTTATTTTTLLVVLLLLLLLLYYYYTAIITTTTITFTVATILLLLLLCYTPKLLLLYYLYYYYTTTSTILLLLHYYTTILLLLQKTTFW